MKKINREDLIKKLMIETGEYKYTVEKFVNHYEGLIIKTLMNGEDVRLHGFINFTIKQNDERVYKDLKTGKLKTAPSVKKVKIKASERLDRLVNKR